MSAQNSQCCWTIVSYRRAGLNDSFCAWKNRLSLVKPAGFRLMKSKLGLVNDKMIQCIISIFIWTFFLQCNAFNIRSFACIAWLLICRTWTLGQHSFYFNTALIEILCNCFDLFKITISLFLLPDYECFSRNVIKVKKFQLQIWKWIERISLVQYVFVWHLLSAG